MTGDLEGAPRSALPANRCACASNAAVSVGAHGTSLCLPSRPGGCREQGDHLHLRRGGESGHGIESSSSGGSSSRGDACRRAQQLARLCCNAVLHLCLNLHHLLAPVPCSSRPATSGGPPAGTRTCWPPTTRQARGEGGGGGGPRERCHGGRCGCPGCLRRPAGARAASSPHPARPSSPPCSLQVHWFSIVNSLMIVLFLRQGAPVGWFVA